MRPAESPRPLLTAAAPMGSARRGGPPCAAPRARGRSAGKTPQPRCWPPCGRGAGPAASFALGSLFTAVAGSRGERKHGVPGVHRRSPSSAPPPASLSLRKTSCSAPPVPVRVSHLEPGVQHGLRDAVHQRARLLPRRRGRRRRAAHRLQACRRRRRRGVQVLRGVGWQRGGSRAQIDFGPRRQHCRLGATAHPEGVCCASHPAALLHARRAARALLPSGAAGKQGIKGIRLAHDGDERAFILGTCT